MGTRLGTRFEWRPVTAFLPMVVQSAGRVRQVRAVQSWKDLARARVRDKG